MKKNPLKVRWLADQCYEFILPDGKHLITDPGITAKEKTPELVALLESIEGCDYVLVTHSHYASTADLKYLEERFKPFIFMSSLQCEAVFNHLDLDYSRLHPLHHGQTFELEDFEFTAYVGKHGGKNHTRDRLMHMDDATAGPEYWHASILGNVESFDFYITFSNNLRVAFVSGEDDVKNTYSIAREFKPNVIIRMYLAWSVDRYAAAIDRYGAEVAIAGHHDKHKAFHGDRELMRQFGMDTEKALADMGSDVQFICPDPGRWYSIGTVVE